MGWPNVPMPVGEGLGPNETGFNIPGARPKGKCFLLSFRLRHHGGTGRKASFFNRWYRHSSLIPTRSSPQKRDEPA